jgi:hypothetical protein
MSKIAATGFDHWDATFIKTTVTLAAGLDVGAWEYVDRQEEADVVLVNAATARGAAVLAHAMSVSNGERPRVIPCSADPVTDDAQTLALRRPLTYPSLVNLLITLQKDLGAAGTPISTALTNDTAPVNGAGDLSAAMPVPDAVVKETVGLAGLSVGDESAADSPFDVQNDTSASPDDAGRPQVAYTEAASVQPEGSEVALPTQPEQADSKPDDQSLSDVEFEGDGSVSTDADTPARVADENAFLGPTTPDDQELPDAAFEGEGISSKDVAMPAKVTDEGATPEPPTRDDEDAISLEEFGSLEKVPELSRKTSGVISGWLREAAAAESRSDLVTEPQPPTRTDGGDGDKVPEAGIGESDPIATGTERGQEKLTEQDRSRRQLDEALRFLGIVREVVAMGKVTEITHTRYAPVWIYPGERLYSTPNDNPLHVEMFRAPSSEFNVRPIATEQLREFKPDWPTAPLWKLLYLSALYGSEGRLKDSAKYSDRLHLIVEPDFNLVPSIPEHRAIARYMSAVTADAVTIAAETGSSVATVIDFSNACDEVLLLERELSPTDGAASTYGTQGQASDTAKQPGRWRRLRSLWSRSD